jgi:predicted mannosyl-3-phosphoglycerate phosphatase (HAD superfamily)
MNQDERAALERLLEYVGRGFCAVQSDCKMLREYLETYYHRDSDDLSAALTRGRELLNGGVVPEPRPLELVHLLAGGKTVTTTIVAKPKKPTRPTASTRATKKSKR